MKKEYIEKIGMINTALLGLLMLVPGLTKLFVSGVEGVSSMLSGNILFSWAPLFWAWALIIAEIGSGSAILFRWKTKYVVYIPVIILAVAVFTVSIKWSSVMSTSWSGVIFHLIAIVGYISLAYNKK